MFDHGRALAAGWDDDAEFITGDRQPTVSGRFEAQVDLLGCPQSPPLRARLHSVLALYANAPTREKRLKLLDLLEDMTLQIAAVMAAEMLEAGWRSDTGSAVRPGLRAR